MIYFLFKNFYSIYLYNYMIIIIYLVMNLIAHYKYYH